MPVHPDGPDRPEDHITRRDELIVGLAINALDNARDRRTAEDLVRTDPEAAAELDHYRAVAAELASLHETAPPPRLKDEVLQRIDDAGSSSPDVVPLRTARRHRRAMWIMSAVASVSLAVAVPSLTVAITQYNRSVEATDTFRELTRMVTSPDAQVTGTTTTGGGRLAAVTAGDEHLVVARDLPALYSDRDYQLWTLDDDGNPTSAGVFDGESGLISVASDSPGQTTRALAVTDEPSGGSPEPTTDPVVVLAVE